MKAGELTTSPAGVAAVKKCARTSAGGRGASSVPSALISAGTVCQESLLIGPGSVVRLARVATLEFLANGTPERDEADGTMYSPGLAKPLAGATVFGPP